MDLDLDGLLIQRMRRGDEDALNAFVTKYYPVILKYCHQGSERERGKPGSPDRGLDGTGESAGGESFNMLLLILSVVRLEGSYFMKERPYHHGDLRHALIETGIDFIKQKGEEALSLRKIAEICGVSNAAPYAHFKSKDEFVVAIQKYIMDLFATELEKTVIEYKDSPSLLPMLGKTYAMFFYQNPFYFDFLFSRKNISIKLSFDSADTDENLPLAILQKAAISVFSKTSGPWCMD